MQGKVFYDLTYSPDENIYYCVAFLPNGSEIFTTEGHKYRELAQNELLNHYPQAELLNDDTAN